MQNICIVTDNSIQFPDGKLSDVELISIIEHRFSVGGKSCKFPTAMKSELPLSLSAGKLMAPKIIPPSTAEFYALFSSLSATYRTIICITASAGLTSTYNNALAAAGLFKNSGNIRIYDSSTTSLGLGYIVQSTLKSILSGATVDQIDRMIRAKISQSYSIVASPSLS
ncbi:MAG: hypothetical protein HPY76_13410, partial [Anaerolineae bacterium]|nr:hypothetical protein [Anaerolineae bacterium]